MLSVRHLTTILIVILSTATSSCRSPAQKEADFLARGRALADKGEYARAILEFQNAAKAVPTDAEPLYQLGIANLRLQNAPVGAALLKKAVELNPKHAQAQAALAVLLAETSHPELLQQASTGAASVIQADPSNIDAWNALAVAELKLGNPEDAAKHISEALQRFPGDLRSSATMASVKLAQKDYTGAEAVMKEAVSHAPQSVECALALGEFYTIVKRLPDSEKEFRRAVSLDPHSARALFALATVQDRQGRHDDAEATLKQLSQLKEPEWNVIYGDYLYRRGKRDVALVEYQRLLSAYPSDRAPRTRVVTALLASGKRSEASRIVSEALRKNPNDSDALVQRAGMYVDEGKVEQAFTDLNRALQNSRNSGRLHYFLAQVHRLREEPALERQELEQAVELEPDQFVARMRLAHMMTVAGAPRSAVELLDRTPAGQKSLLAVAVERNNALYALRQFGEVRQNLDRLLPVAPHEPVVLLQDGLLRLTQKDYTGARRSLEEVLKQRPQEWRAVQALADSYLQQGNKPAALAIVRSKTAAHAESPSAQLFAGEWMLRAGEIPQARAALEAARKGSSPEQSVRIDHLLAETDIAENKTDAARQRLSTTLANFPRSVETVFALAQVEQQSGRTREAAQYYERVLQANGDNLVALNNLSYLLVDTGVDIERGLQLAQKAQQLAPDNPVVNDTAGWAYYRKGLYSSAVALLTKGASSGPRAQCHLAMAYAKTGEPGKARKLLDAVQRADPSIPELGAGLALLGPQKSSQ